MEDGWVEVKYREAKDRLGPVLTLFPHATPPASFFDPASPSYSNFQLYTNQAAHKSHQKAFYGENPKWAFKGVNYGQATEFSQSSNYAFGLLDKTSGTLTLTDFEGVFAMEQVLKADLQKPVTEKRNITNEELRSQLIESFGTKKTKQRLKIAKNREIDESAIASKEKIAKGIKAETDSHPNDEMVESQRDHLPPFNLEAVEQADIYPLSQLITEELRDELDIRFLLKCYKKPKLVKKLVDSWEKFSIGLLDNLSAEEPDKLRGAAYLNALLRFYKKSRVITIRPEQFSEFTTSAATSEAVALHILHTFYQETKTKSGAKYQRTKTQTDKLISYMLVLILTCSDFVVDPSKLAEVLKLPQTKVVTYLRSVGCRPTANNTYTLRTPLIFPSVVRRRNR